MQFTNVDVDRGLETHTLIWYTDGDSYKRFSSSCEI